MTTRLDLRTALRRRLEDTTASPLWDDASLDEALTGAMGRYGAHVPIDRQISVTIPELTTRIAVDPLITARQVIRVLDADDVPVPRAWGELPPAGEGQAWRWWDNALVLARPLSAAQTWWVEYVGTRPLPANDTTRVEIVPGDEGIVIGLAAVAALTRRAVEDAKRGLNAQPTMLVAAAIEADAGELLRHRGRRALGGWLTA